MVSWWSSWFSKDVTAQQMVQDRDHGLAHNTDKVDDITRVKENLRQCFDAVKNANPTLFTAFKDPPDKIVSEKEMAEQLRIVMMATMTNLNGLDQDLQKAREKRELLEHLIAIWERIDQNFDNALKNGEQAIALDERNVENLTELRVLMQRAGQTPTCRNGSMV